MRKKLVAGGLAALGALALGVGGTYAAFSSTVQGPDTLTQAGTLNLELSTDRNVAIQPIHFENLVPGDANFYYIELTNTGTIAGKIFWAFDNVEELENDCFPAEITAGDPTCESGPNQGELGNQLAVTFSQMPGPGCTGTPRAVGPPSFPSSFSQPVFQSLAGLVLAPNTSRCVRVDVRFQDLPNNNEAQSDSSSFGFRFQLTQVSS